MNKPLACAGALRNASSFEIEGRTSSARVTLTSGKQTPQSFERAFKATPLGRSSTVEDIVRAVRFILATPSLTGQVLPLDGGESLAGRPRDVAFQVK